MSEFEAVIGLEVHCQLATRTKLFCRCFAKPESGQSVAEIEVNINTCPVCTAQPGSLPVMNEQALRFAIAAGLAAGCTIRERSVFARKNYFYPDLPKGYQISQFDLPICENGFLEIETKSGLKKVHIQRMHLEEDAGKNLHMQGFSLVNLNRAGVPLIEIVSGPDMRSSEEAGALMRAIYAMVTYLEICDGNLQEGNFRCDANVSVRPKGSDKFGTRTETKNINSFRFLEKAIDYEIERQTEVIKSGGKVIQETRGFDSEKGITVSLRSKEEAHDYRYFPDPDLLPLFASAELISEIKKSLPELPNQKRARFQSELGLSAYDAGVLTSSKPLAVFFEAALSLLSGDSRSSAKLVSNLLSGEVARLMNENEIEISQSRIKPAHIADVARLLQAGTVSSTGAKEIIAEIWNSGEGVSTVLDRLGLRQVSDVSALLPAIDEVLDASPAQVGDFKSGKDKLIGYFVGQVMKKTGGKANPAILQDLIRKRISER